ncbi:hypothetical protein BU25DRAFT_491736 [Macroventuria anomochaeta]|uniref:Uncharacterized protein n=1 Tax=Macroventuria anomochaeta TaxID=301207 RepID=A0ACB6S068_9PLEO|nr:uncharacterized protein BU25DRAFT_491736 [Macroventuria anomochaeta]KAF2626798.1 hypothetical protein BU25DRAFT_491736 [Macroventuria anomochaeta]
MPYYHNLAPARKDPATYDHTTPPVNAPLAPKLQHAVHDAGSQIDGPADHRPQMVPFATRNDYRQPVNHFQQQQQQGHRHYQYQYPQMQDRPVHHVHSTAAPHLPSKQQETAAGSAVTTLLPYCTAEVPLNESQVIAVTDVAGSLKELVLLALRAKDGDEECVGRLEGALGSEQALAGIVDFFSDEFEIE